MRTDEQVLHKEVKRVFGDLPLHQSNKTSEKATNIDLCATLIIQRAISSRSLLQWSNSEGWSRAQHETRVAADQGDTQL